MGQAPPTNPPVDMTHVSLTDIAAAEYQLQLLGNTICTLIAPLTINQKTALIDLMKTWILTLKP